MMVLCCEYLSYFDKKVTVLKLGKAHGGKSDNQSKTVLQKLSECFT